MLLGEEPFPCHQAKYKLRKMTTFQPEFSKSSIQSFVCGISLAGLGRENGTMPAFFVLRVKQKNTGKIHLFPLLPPLLLTSTVFIGY